MNEPHGICKSSSDTPTTLISSPSFSAAVSIDTNTSLDTESYHDTIDVDSQSEEFSHDAESGAEECLFSPNAIALVDPDQNSDSEDDAGKNANSKPYASGRNCLDLTLPPISDIREIFLDITLKALKEGLSGVIEKFVGKQINVATLCSGTESPLLAMTLVQQCKYTSSLSMPVILICFELIWTSVERARIKGSPHSPHFLLRD